MYSIIIGMYNTGKADQGHKIWGRIITTTILLFPDPSLRSTALFQHICKFDPGFYFCTYAALNCTLLCLLLFNNLFFHSGVVLLHFFKALLLTNNASMQSQSINNSPINVLFCSTFLPRRYVANIPHSMYSARGGGGRAGKLEQNGLV
jgi:hypothetical protein